MIGSGANESRLPPLGPEVLAIDGAAEADFIATAMRHAVAQRIRRRGAVVAVSGGIDSALCLALTAKAVGAERTLALLLPERESSAASLTLGRQVAERFGVATIVHDLTAALEGMGAYATRDDAIRTLFPEYGAGWRSKIVIAGGLVGGYNYHNLVVAAPDGTRREARLGSKTYLTIVAAQNHKQRLRKTMEYHHADRLHYAVVGTPNRLEYDQGFFVKNGDGAADIKPIAHLYKSQVYALARHLGVPEEICSARPTTDTYSLGQTQDEFFFALPYEKMDLALWAKNHGYSPAELAQAAAISPPQAEHVFRDIDMKRETTRTLHSKPVLIRAVPEIEV
jgi:NAD+ synthase